MKSKVMADTNQLDLKLFLDLHMIQSQETHININQALSLARQRAF